MSELKAYVDTINTNTIAIGYFKTSEEHPIATLVEGDKPSQYSAILTATQKVLEGLSDSIINQEICNEDIVICTQNQTLIQWIESGKCSKYEELFESVTTLVDCISDKGCAVYFEKIDKKDNLATKLVTKKAGKLLKDTKIAPKRVKVGGAKTIGHESSDDNVIQFKAAK